jgi:flagellar basal-body rod protein FlgC
MSLSSAMRISSTGMTAERFRMDVISMNLAGANTVRTAQQEAYRRQDVIFTSAPDGVRISGVRKDMSQLRAEYEPGHPAADANGLVFYSNVQPVREMVDMVSASRAYEANIAAFNSAKTMVRSAMTIGKV